MDESLLHNSFILFEIICVITVFAIFIIRSHYFTEILEHHPRISTQILFMVFYGLISIVGTITGIGLFGSIGNVRDIGPMMAGLTCGPFIGIGAGIIGGIFRFMQGGPYMYTGLSAPIFCGIMGGILYIVNKQEFVSTRIAVLYMALCDTLVSIVTLTLVTPLDQLWIITKNIAIPMIAGSTLGVFIFSYFIHFQIKERKKEIEFKKLERKNADRKNLDSIINTLADPVFLINKQYNWRLVNDSFCQFIRRSRDDLIGKSVSEFFSKSEYETIHDQCDRVFKDGISLEKEMNMFGLDDIAITIISKASLYNDSDGQEFVVWIMRDISERKKIEDTLKESEAQLSSVLHCSPIMQFVIDNNHQVISWNKAIENFTGISADNIIGTTDHWRPFYREYHPMLVDILIDENFDILPQLYCDQVRKAQYVEGSYEGTEYMTDINSIGRWFYFAAAPVKDTKGEIIGAMETILDISETKKLESALKLTVKKLNLLSSITRHDILNKITVLSGYLFLAREFMREPDGLGFLSDAKNTTDIIQRQIEFTREYQELGIKEPVWQKISEVAISAFQEIDSVSVALEIASTSVEIYADPLLKKVFHNLFENAKRHGERVSVIRIYEKVSDSGLIITVSDDGTGISYDEKELIFERGFGKNTGWGLFLSSEILAITGITIREVGIPGKGAVFELLVPNSGFRPVV